MKNKKIIEKVKKQSGGITLIALIITIIVLLILAGVTIVTLTGDNGLLGKTSESKFITEIQHYNEELKLSITEDYTNSMGNRQNKFNVRRNSYNEENSFIDAMKSKIPSFDNKYANKLEIKEDKLNYIGDNEQERAWLAQVISVAGMLKISYVYEDGNQAAPTYQKVITDGSYEVESPKIDNYEPDHYIVEGTVNKDVNVTVTYYRESQDLAYEELSDGTYTVAGIGTFTGENLVIPKEYNEKAVTQIKKEAFYSCNTIKKLIIQDNIKIVNQSAFEACNNIEYISLNAETLKSLYSLRCPNLTRVEIGRNVKTIEDRVFYKCTKLTDVTIYTEQADINAWQFEGCNNLKYVKTNKENTKYKSIEGILYAKDEKKIYMYPPAQEGNFIIPEYVEEIGNYSFVFNKNLTKLNIPANIKLIGNSAFEGCNNITYISVDAEKIKSMSLRCPNLTRVEIGTNVKTIEYNAFYNCKKIEEVKYNGTMQQWNQISRNEWNNNSNITKVICTDGTVDV